MNNIQLSSRYAARSASMDNIQIIATYREGDHPLAPGAGGMPWPDLEEPGGLGAPQGEAVAPGELGEPGDPHAAVMLHPQPPQGEAHVVNIEGQVNPAFVAAAVAIQDELDHPPVPQANLEVLAPEGVQRPPRCSGTLATFASAVVALGAATSAIVGGVLAFTSDDQQTQGEGLMTFGIGMGMLVTWCAVAEWTNE